MAEILDVVPENIYVIMKFSVDQLRFIRFCLNNSTIEFDGEDAEQKDAVDYVKDGFFAQVNRFLEEFDDARPDGS